MVEENSNKSAAGYKVAYYPVNLCNCKDRCCLDLDSNVFKCLTLYTRLIIHRMSAVCFQSSEENHERSVKHPPKLIIVESQKMFAEKKHFVRREIPKPWGE